MTDALPVLMEVFAERIRQDDKWGLQNHDIGGSPAFRVTANNARDRTEQAAQEGTLTWRQILHEEFWETFAETDPQAQRAELVQVAAVAVAMIECIDRKARLALPKTDLSTPICYLSPEAQDSSGDGAGAEESPEREEAPPQDQAQDVS